MATERPNVLATMAAKAGFRAPHGAVPSLLVDPVPRTTTSAVAAVTALK